MSSSSMSSLLSQPKPQAYLAKLEDRSSRLASIPLSELPLSSDSEDTLLSSERCSPRVQKLLQTLNVVFQESRFDPSTPRWGEMYRMLQLSCVKGGYRFSTYTVDAPDSTTQAADVLQDEGSQKYFLAETEEEWFAFEKQMEKERKVKEWRRGIQTDATTVIEPVMDQVSEVSEVQIVEVEPPTEKVVRKDTANSTNGQLGFKVVRKHSSLMSAAGAKPKDKRPGGKAPPPPEEPRQVSPPPAVEEEPQQEPSSKSAPASSRDRESPPQSTSPSGEASSSKPPSTREKPITIEDIDEPDLFPPSFPSHLHTSTPPPQRRKPDAIPRNSSPAWNIDLSLPPPPSPPHSQSSQSSQPTSAKRPLEQDISTDSAAPQLKRLKTSQQVRPTTPSSKRPAVPTLTELMASNKRKKPRVSSPVLLIKTSKNPRASMTPGAAPVMKAQARVNGAGAGTGAEDALPQPSPLSEREKHVERSLSSLAVGSPPPSPSLKPPPSSFLASPSRPPSQAKPAAPALAPVPSLAPPSSLALPTDPHPHSHLPIPHTQTVHEPPAFTQESAIFDPLYDSDKNGLTATDLCGGGGTGPGGDGDALTTTTEVGRAQLVTTESYPYAYKTGTASRMSSAAGLGTTGRLPEGGIVGVEVEVAKQAVEVRPEPMGKFEGLGMYSSQFDVEANVDRMSELLDRDVDFADWVHDS